MAISKSHSLGILISASIIALGALAQSGFAAGLPQTVTFVAVQDLTGGAGKPGAATQKGIDLAVDEINKSDFLGGSKIDLVSRDSATNPAQGASVMSTVLGLHPAVVFGSIASNVAVAEAPIAQRGHQPLVFTQAGSKGILEAGDYIYRATPLQTAYFHKTAEYMSKIGIKRVGLITDTFLPTTNDLRGIFKDLAPKLNMEVVDDEEAQSTSADMSTQITKLIDSKADAVVVMMLAGRNVTVVSLLRQNGYKGRIFSQLGMGGGALASIGDVGNGVVWCTDFTARQKNEGAVKFVAAYKAKFNGENPPFYAAEGYDAVYFAALAVKKAGSVEPDAVLKGLAAVADEGYVGALGTNKFIDRQELGSGVLVEWKHDDEFPVE